MSAPRQRNAGVAPGGFGKTQQASTKPTPATAAPQAPAGYTVVVDDARRTTWGHYATRDKAEAAATALRKHGFAARVVEQGSL